MTLWSKVDFLCIAYVGLVVQVDEMIRVVYDTHEINVNCYVSNFLSNFWFLI